MSTKTLTNIQQHSIFESGRSRNPLEEIVELTSLICPGITSSIIEKAHHDVCTIFSGDYPGFKESVTKYHNLRHTHSVVLATIRLFHGLFHEERVIDEDLVLQGLLSAYFHDLGMLPQTSAELASSMEYARHHERRSIAILENYLEANGLPREYALNCSTIIHFTNLDWEEEPNGSIDSQLELCGQVLETADLLAQMADRYYLESLPFLFQEHRDCGIDTHNSALELMCQTLEFHEKVIKKRLEKILGNIAPAMQTHFLQRWGIDRNLYLDNIRLNLEYLSRITEDCSLDLSCWSKYLRRKPPEKS